MANYPQRRNKDTSHALAAALVKADNHALQVWPTIEEMQTRGIITTTGLAKALNEEGIRSRYGKRWHSTSVRNLLNRLKKMPGRQTAM